MKRILPLLLLVGLLLAFRVLGAMWGDRFPGFEPLTAVFFCVAACVGWRWLWVPLAAWLVSYPITNAIHDYPWDWQLLVSLAGFALAVWVGWALRKKHGAVTLLAGAGASALFFYFATNFGAWLLLPDYPKTLAGFVQAEWTGAPHHLLPTWVFLKNGILGNLLFTGLFLLGQHQWGREPDGQPAAVRVRR